MIDIVAKILAEKATKIKRYPCKVNRASSIGYFVPELEGCLRRGVYERTHWEQKQLHDAAVQLIFEEGHNQERQVLRDLSDAGVDVIEQQGAFEWADYQITGHIDGVVIVDGKPVPIEIKSMHPNIFTQVHTLEDFKKKPWTRAYLAQIQIYMLSKNVDKAIFILKNKSTGEIRQIVVDLDYELAECCLKTAEAINKHLEAKTLPDRVKDIEKCKQCPFNLVCLPQMSFGEPLKIVDDPMFVQRVDEYMALKADAKRADDVYGVIRDRCKATAGKGELNIMAGKYHLTGKPDSRGAFRLKIEST